MNTHLTWREHPHYSRQEHDAVQARYRALVRDRWAHPRTVKP